MIGFVFVKCCLGEPDENGERHLPPILAKFKGSKLDRMKAKHPWLDRESLVMNGEHVTLAAKPTRKPNSMWRTRANAKTPEKPEPGLSTLRPDTDTTTLSSANNTDLEVFCPVDNAGRFTGEVEHFAGENIFQLIRR
jgi:isoleucyl-tRNA synthetase